MSKTYEAHAPKTPTAKKQLVHIPRSFDSTFCGIWTQCVARKEMYNPLLHKSDEIQICTDCTKLSELSRKGATKSIKSLDTVSVIEFFEGNLEGIFTFNNDADGTEAATDLFVRIAIENGAQAEHVYDYVEQKQFTNSDHDFVMYIAFSDERIVDI